jgi:hypothetical protein
MEGFNAYLMKELALKQTQFTSLQLIKQAASQGRRCILLYLTWKEVFELHDLKFSSELISKSQAIGPDSFGWHSISW